MYISGGSNKPSALIIRNRVIFLVVFFLCLRTTVLAQEKTSIGDKFIGSTFKSLAKAYISVVDLKKLKKTNIEKIKAMDEEKFEKRYAKVFMVISELPKKVRTTYGISEGMTKEQVTRKINSWDKKKICGIIDSIPEELIAKYFKEYVNKSKQNVKDSNLIDQVRSFWERIIRRAAAFNSGGFCKDVLSA